MRALVQRVTAAAVTIGGEEAGRIDSGLMILLGVTHADTLKEVVYTAAKCANLRNFEDDHGKMTRSLLDIGGAALVVSQFTLYGDASAGRRPSFTEAARPETAIPLYEAFLSELAKLGVPVASGRFGAEMQVEIHNDGPVTLLVESP